MRTEKEIVDLFIKISSEDKPYWTDTKKNFLAGALAAVIATGATIPLDTLATAVQAEKNINVKALKLTEIGKLYSGLGYKLLKVGPMMGIQFSAQPYIKEKLDKWLPNK